MDNRRVCVVLLLLALLVTGALVAVDTSGVCSSSEALVCRAIVPGNPVSVILFWVAALVLLIRRRPLPALIAVLLSAVPPCVRALTWVLFGAP